MIFIQFYHNAFNFITFDELKKISLFLIMTNSVEQSQAAKPIQINHVESPIPRTVCPTVPNHKKFNIEIIKTPPPRRTYSHKFFSIGEISHKEFIITRERSFSCDDKDVKVSTFPDEIEMPSITVPTKSKINQSAKINHSKNTMKKSDNSTEDLLIFD